VKVVAINGSPRREGNTAILIDEVLARVQAAGIETEHVGLAGYHLAGCVGCGRCGDSRDLTCAQGDDGFNALMAKVVAAQGVIVGSPVYFADMTANLKAFTERAGMVSLMCGQALQRKRGAAGGAVRRAGAVNTFDSINHLFQTSQMLVVGSSYWNLGIGREAGEVRGDEEALVTMRNLGDTMVWALEGLCGDRSGEQGR